MASLDMASTAHEAELLSASCVVNDYLVPFAGGEAAGPFVEYLSIGNDKQLHARELTRHEFFKLALVGASLLRTHHVMERDSVVHWFTDNRVEDLIFRMASVLNGSVPVTINWQSDTLERALYKVKITNSRVALIDDGVPPEATDTLPHMDCEPLVAAIYLSEHSANLPASLVSSSTRAEDTRIVIFTSGTTGRPKGVKLSYGAYRCNRSTFEAFLGVRDGDGLECVVTNPMHHTNSTAITDWAMRRPGAKLRLVQRYTTAYWRVVACAGAGLAWAAGKRSGEEDDDAALGLAVAGAVEARRRRAVVCPLVARHVDFLDALAAEGKLPVAPATLKSAIADLGVILLLGSAPVGPTTVARLEEHVGALPVVRFGSTETCLQVCGTPLVLPRAVRLDAFKAGWGHVYEDRPATGYYIGRHHVPHTEVCVVKSVDAAAPTYLAPCGPGEPGQIVTRGANLMSGYVADDGASAKALDAATGWYTNLGDVGYYLVNPTDGGHDLYWLSRGSAMLIRGGANYAYEQINSDLTAWAAAHFALDTKAFEVAVVGARVDSEHEDTCCVTIELKTPEALAKADVIKETFVSAAKESAKRKGGLSKGSVPDRIRVADLPKNFKGTVLVNDLIKAWTAAVAAK